MFITLLLLQAAASSTQPPLNLTCFGSGTANKMAVASATTSGSVFGSVGGTPYSGFGSATTNVHGTRQQDFSDQVDIRLFAGDDRIRMPRTMLPLVRGGEDGWFKLKKVEADDKTIRASASVNLINNPKVHIDRLTGSLSISGKAGDFTGQCQVVDTTAKPKF
jgi:hypothetical protein